MEELEMRKWRHRNCISSGLNEAYHVVNKLSGFNEEDENEILQSLNFWIHE